LEVKRGRAGKGSWVVTGDGCRDQEKLGEWARFKLEHYIRGGREVKVETSRKPGGEDILITGDGGEGEGLSGTGR